VRTPTVAFVSSTCTFLRAAGRLRTGTTEIALGEGAREPGEEGPVATVDVDDVKAERASLAEAGVEVGTVLELHGAMRLVDVYDPDGNRLQLAQELP